MARKSKIAGWGNLNPVETTMLKCTGEEVLNLVDSDTSSFALRGNGKSYGDVALSRESTVHYLGSSEIRLDVNTNVVECSASLSLSELQVFLEAHDRSLFVIPGISTITVGGAIACDVHGKNHVQFGSFGNHLEGLEILIGNGEINWCSNSENEELFRATIGGIGLIGVILTARIRVRTISTKMIGVRNQKMSNLEDVIQAFEQNTSEFATAWLKNAAEIIFSTGDFCASPTTKPLNKRKLWWNFGGILTSKGILSLVEWNRYRSVKLKPYFQHYTEFLQPLDALENWNELYPKGVVQLQFWLPKAKIVEGIEHTFAFLKKENAVTFLATLKCFGKHPKAGMLSFPREGFTFTIDIKYSLEIDKKFQPLLDQLVMMGARFYAAKDAIMQPHHLSNEEDLEAFKSVVLRFGKGKFHSEFSKRLQLTETKK